MNCLFRNISYYFICRLLLDAKVDMNCQTHQGTALHEAALYGKTGAVKMLIDVSIYIHNALVY